MPKAIYWGSHCKNPGLSRPNSEIFTKDIIAFLKGKTIIFYHKDTFSKIFRKLIPRSCDLGRKKNDTFPLLIKEVPETQLSCYLWKTSQQGKRQRCKFYPVVLTKLYFLECPATVQPRVSGAMYSSLTLSGCAVVEQEYLELPSEVLTLW